MSNTTKKYLDYSGLSTVADKIKERLQKVTTMPVSPSNGDTVLYVGATSGGFTKGLIYTYNSSTSTWEAATSSAAILPPASSSNTEATVVTDIGSAPNTDTNAASAYAVQQWSNVDRKRVIIPISASSAGINGYGTWNDTTNETGWYQSDYFKIPDNAKDIDIEFKYNPQINNGEVVALGGYILDTTTGKICLKFANTVYNQQQIAIDIVYTRNNYPTT